MPSSSPDLRKAFLDFFKERDHPIRPSAPLIPPGDPTLMFTSAGMVQFKPYYLGLKADLKRAASCQKCIRTTDIDLVGTTLRHLTFFEMLGNFSFGDYFKKETISWAWEFLTREMNLDPKKLHISVYKDDEEALEIWKKLGPTHPIAKLGEETNFWNMGRTGPCGPCSEIYYDLGETHSCGKPSCGPGCECDRYLEIWNLVFTQFDRQEDRSLKPLPRKNIDTGMGLERLTMVVQGKRSPFETDLFWPVMEEASDILKALPGKTPQTKHAFRVIGDHIRAACFLISEGVIPSNVERGYVLRRLIRRALRYGRLLGHKETFVHRLAEPVSKIFPELEPFGKDLQNTLRMEEEMFLETLETGEAALEEILSRRPKTLPGESAFKLYETYGFPFELTREIADSRGIPVDVESYESARLEAQEIARAGWKGSGQRLGLQRQYEEWLKKAGLTKPLWYEALASECRIVGYQAEVEIIGAWKVVEITLDQTPFYPEGGGQIGDVGWIHGPGFKLEVLDTFEPIAGLVVHRCRIAEGDPVAVQEAQAKELSVHAQVNENHRKPTMYHHTATHLLNEALRRVLGPQVRQAGSLVAPDHLRFDFTCPRALTEEEVRKVEDLVNQKIRENLKVSPKEQPASKAAELGAVTLLGEKYGDKPRFVLISPKDWDSSGSSRDSRFSLELCGGTHVHNTGEIGSFKIVKESSVAAGIRRIEAVAGPAVQERSRRQTEELKKVITRDLEKVRALVASLEKLAGKSALSDQAGRAVSLCQDLLGLCQGRNLPEDHEDLKKTHAGILDVDRALRVELGALKSRAVAEQGEKGRSVREIADGIRLLSQRFEGMDLAHLRNLSDRWRKEFPSSVILLANSRDQKVSFIVSVTEDLTRKGVDAVLIAKAAAKAVSGSAGGRPDFAQGGGAEPSDWEAVVREVESAVRKLARP